MTQSSKRLKPESRVLELLISNGFAIGIVIRGDKIEHFIIEKFDEGFARRIGDRSVLREVRKVVVKGEVSESTASILGAEMVKELPHERLLSNVLKEILKLSEGIKDEVLS
ncbi:MAG: hypothetical protein JHC28_00120 [Thermoprotei archaeon]|nr:hypothetical protein [Thermoprotei archaeon]